MLLDFHDSIQVVPLKYAFISLVIKSFVNPFVDIALAFFDSSFNSFLFDITSFRLLSKSAFFTKLTISFLLAKFACFNLEANVSAENLLNSGVVIYLSWLWSVIFFWISLIFYSQFITNITNIRCFIFNSSKSGSSS